MTCMLGWALDNFLWLINGLIAAFLCLALFALRNLTLLPTQKADDEQ